MSPPCLLLAVTIAFGVLFVFSDGLAAACGFGVDAHAGLSAEPVVSRLEPRRTARQCGGGQPRFMDRRLSAGANLQPRGALFAQSAWRGPRARAVVDGPRNRCDRSDGGDH